MWPEVTGAAFVFVLLSLLGLGPALWLLEVRPRRVPYALALAPALGFVVVSLIAFPLARHLAPVRDWAWPVTAALTAASLAWAGRDFWHRRADYAILSQAGRIWPYVGMLAAGALVLFVPLLLRGIQYSIFRSNPSDAFLYMTLAETLRVVKWPVLVSAAELTRENFEALANLAVASPTALFTARHAGMPLALNKMALFAWSAEMARVEVQRFYMAHHLLAYLAALPLTMAMGARLGLPRWQQVLAAGVALGFWPRFIIEMDSGYEISAFPVLLLAAFAWIEIEGQPSGQLSRGHLMLALALAALLALYAPILLIVALAFGIYYGFGLLQRQASLRHVWVVAASGLLLVPLILAVTGQLDFLFASTLDLLARAANEANFRAPTMDLIRLDGLNAIWGMPGSLLWDMRAAWLRWPVDLVVSALSLVLSAAVLAGGLLALMQPAQRTERIVFALVAAGGLFMLYVTATGNQRSAGKAFTYIFAFLIFGLLVTPRLAANYLPRPGRALASGLLGIWLVGQLAVGAYLPLRRTPDFIRNPQKTADYDLSPLLNYLEQHDPEMLLVAVPTGTSWPFALYSMFAFSRYPVHFQTGLVIDNNLAHQTLWLSTLNALPSHIIVTRDADYVAPQQLGTKVAETADLVLYEATSSDLATFQAQEAVFQQSEALKTPFPSLQP
jgi:hypothetical protein